MTDVKSQPQTTTSRYLDKETDLHIALFIVANDNTAVKQLSEGTIWGGEDLNLTFNGSPSANNSQVIWIQLLWIERKCRLAATPANYMNGISVTKPYCIDHQWLWYAGRVMKELRDLIWCCIRFTKEFGFCTSQLRQSQALANDRPLSCFIKRYMCFCRGGKVKYGSLYLSEKIW